MKSVRSLRSFYDKAISNALYRNSLFLVLSSVVLSGFGFIFWLLCAKFYPPEEIGQATALISLINLLSSFSILGIGNTLIRYLGTSSQKNEKISTSLLITGFFACVLFGVYALGAPIFTPALASLLGSPFRLFFLCLGIVAGTYSFLFDSIFTGLRSARFTFIKNFLLSVGKVVFPIFFISLGGFGIVTAFILSTALAVLVSFYILMHAFQFVFIPAVNSAILRQMWRYSFGNYIANFVITLPTYILPIYVLNTLGARESAYYYMAYMIANLLFTIPFSVSNSFVAEGSHNLEQVMPQLKRSFRFTFLLLTPSVLGIFLFGHYILLAFGKTYSSSGILLLQLLSVSSIFVACNSLCISILRIEERIKALIGYSVVLSTATICFSIVLTPYKLAGIGMAFLLATFVAFIYNGIVVLWPYIKRFR